MKRRDLIWDLSLRVPPMRVAFTARPPTAAAAMQAIVDRALGAWAVLRDFAEIDERGADNTVLIGVIRRTCRARGRSKRSRRP